MSDPMTDERLAEIEARANAATKGPWEVYDLPIEHFYDTNHKLGIGSGSKSSLIYAVAKVEGMGSLSEGDAAFIAHARRDVPDLVVALRQFTTLPPDVAEAMQRVSKRLTEVGNWTVVEYEEGTNADLHTIAAHFTKLFQKGA